MTISRKLLAGIALILMSPVIVVVLWISYAVGHGLLLKAMGYDVDIDPKELAVLIYENHESVKRCSNLMQAVPTMGPTIGDKRMRCIYEYASISKDPTACELLMPSEYGWSCLGGAMDFEPCVFLADGKKTVKGQGIVTTLDECLSGPLATRTHVCCQMARITFQDGNTESCASFDGSDSLSDQCHHEVAIKKNSIDECSLIKNERNRTGCTVGVRALRK